MPKTVPHRAPNGSIGAHHSADIGVSRRLQALAVAGWPHPDLAARLRVSPARLRALFAGRSCSGMRQPVVELYARLAGLRPPDTADARSARGSALYRGWAPAEAWPGETIDDPAARPVTQYLLNLAEDVAWMAATGESLAGVCRRLKVAPKSLYSDLDRAGRLDLWRLLSPYSAAAA